MEHVSAIITRFIRQNMEREDLCCTLQTTISC